MPLSYDFETFSEPDLTKTGMYVYFEHPSADVLCMSVKLDEQPTVIWTPDCGPVNEWMPEIAYRAKHRDEFHAHNAGFEWCCTNTHAGQRIGMPRLDITQMRDTAARAASLGLPRAMGNCAKVLKLAVQKDEEGKAIMRKLTRPRKPTKDNPLTRYTPQSHPTEFAKLYSYCINDTDTEHGIDEFLGPLSPYEQAVWEMDLRINSRGVPVDLELARNIVKMRDEYVERLSAECKAICGYEPSQVAQILNWLGNVLGFKLPLADDYGRLSVKALASLDKDNLKHALGGIKAGNTQVTALLPGPATQTTFDAIYRVLEIRQQTSQTSAKKFDAILTMANSDARIRGVHLYWGAGPGRWAGRGLQMQNTKKSVIGEHHSKEFKKANPDYNMSVAIADTGAALTLKGVEMMFAKPMDVFSSLIRPTIKAPPGYEFIVRDYSSVEARIISWLSDEAWRLEVFRTHGKIYEASASNMFNIALELITKDSKWRQSGKVAELALGFQGGVRALIKMGAIDRYGLKYSELKGLVKAWRAANPKIAAMWHAMEAAAVQAMQYGIVTETHKCKFGLGGPNKDFFQVQLPSGRFLSYAYPKLKDVVRVWNEDAGKFERYDSRKHPKVPHIRTRWNDEEQIFENYTHEGFRPDRVIEFWFEGENSTTRQWGEESMYGGKWAENTTQGIAACLLRNALFETENGGYANVFHVHDEGTGCVPIGAGDEEDYGARMCSLPTWAVGLPLASEGFRGTRYKK